MIHAQNGGVVSRLPSTICFTLGYVRYCIKSIPENKQMIHKKSDCEAVESTSTDMHMIMNLVSSIQCVESDV